MTVQKEYESTARCVKCLGTPVVFCGHVHRGQTQLVAGLCTQHESLANPNLADMRPECGLCFGDWIIEMGLRDILG